MCRRRWHALALAATLMAAFVAIVGTPASAAPSGPVAAAGPLTFTLTECESTGKKIGCIINYTGGTPPYTVRWTLNGVPVPDYNNLNSFTTGCAPGEIYRYAATVTDAVGASITYVKGTRCIAGFP
ncbi:MAG: hypothetical protein V7637_6004 [Mycobacteriales bacterium]|jgi:hypothetical protein